MREYIDKEKAKKVLIDDYAYAAAELLDEVPLSDVEEVKHSKWKKIQNYALCSNCKHEVNWGSKDFLSPYCPQCGAKMDKEKEQ